MSRVAAPPPRRARPAAATPAAAAAGDAATTALFVLFSALWGEATARLAPAAGVSVFVAGLAVLVGGLALFDPVARAVGHAAAGAPAIFNPAHALALAVAGRGPSLRAAALRSGAQVAGGAAAALAAARLLPARAAAALPAPSITAPLKTAVIAEVVLGALLATAVVATAASKSRAVAVGVPIAAAAALTAVGAELAAHAPAFNPAVAAAWAWRGGGGVKGLLSHAAAYWAAPLAGGALAGAVWRVLEDDDAAKRRKGRTKATGRAVRAASTRAKRA